MKRIAKPLVLGLVVLICGCREQLRTERPPELVHEEVVTPPAPQPRMIPIYQLKVTETATGETLLEKKLPGGALHQPKVSPGVAHIAYQDESSIHVITPDGTEVLTFHRPELKPSLLGFTASGKFVLLYVGSSSKYGSGFRLLRIADGSVKIAEEGQVDEGRKYVAFLTDNLKCQVNELETGKRLVRSTTYYGSRWDDNDVKAYDLSADGSTMVASYHYATYPGPMWVQIWDVKKRRLKASSTIAHETSDGAWLIIEDVELSWNGRYMANGRYLWDLSKKKEIGQFGDWKDISPGETVPVNDKKGDPLQITDLGVLDLYCCQQAPGSGPKIQFSGSGKMLWEQGEKVQLWDAKTSTKIREWTREQPKTTYEFTADGGAIVEITPGEEPEVAEG